MFLECAYPAFLTTLLFLLKSMFLEPGEKIQKIPLSTLYLYTQFFILHLNRGGQDIRFHVICWSTFKNAAIFLLAGLMKYNSLHQACSEELKVNLLGKPSKSQKINSKINNIYFNFSIFPVFGQIEYYIVSIFSKLYRFYSIFVEIHNFLKNFCKIMSQFLKNHFSFCNYCYMLAYLLEFWSCFLS